MPRWPTPTPPDLFALAGLRFLSGVEGALQLRWQTGFDADWSELPILRLPIPQNPDARAFEAQDLTTLLTDLDADMDNARAALGPTGHPEFRAGDSSVGDLWFDINMNATRDEGEDVFSVAGPDPGRASAWLQADMIAPSIRFDTADAAWLTAYTHLLSAFADVALAYDPASAVERVIASSAGDGRIARHHPAEQRHGHDVRPLGRPRRHHPARAVQQTRRRADPSRPTRICCR